MLSPNPVGASIFIYFFFFFLKHAVYVLNLLLSFAEQVKGTIIGFLPLKEPSQDVEGPLLTLPPWKLRPLIFIDLHRLLQHRQEPVSQSACGAGKCEHLVETGNLFSLLTGGTSLSTTVFRISIHSVRFCLLMSSRGRLYCGRRQGTSHLLQCHQILRCVSKKEN